MVTPISFWRRSFKFYPISLKKKITFTECGHADTHTLFDRQQKHWYKFQAGWTGELSQYVRSSGNIQEGNSVSKTFRVSATFPLSKTFAVFFKISSIFILLKYCIKVFLRTILLKQFLQLQEATLKFMSVHNKCELSLYAGEDTNVGHLSRWCGWADECELRNRLRQNLLFWSPEEI